MDSKILSHQLHHLPRLTRKSSESNTTKINGNNFSSILQEKLNNTELLKVSKHAQKRLAERGISIDSGMWTKISEKVQEAKLKGVHDSLVVTENAALVVSAKNHTVVTAMDRTEATEQIFTNINGTILL